MFVIELASHYVHRDEMSIFVTDLHPFYDEMTAVIDMFLIYDDLFSSLLYPSFCQYLPFVSRWDTVCHVDS